MKRKITAIVLDENNQTIRKAENGSPFIVVDCGATIADDVILPSVRKSVFMDEALLSQVKAGMHIML